MSRHIVAAKQLVGHKFGRLLVTGIADSRDIGKLIVLTCKCDCGAECLAVKRRLTNGKKRSCGCVLKEMSRNGLLNRRHGHAARRSQSPEYTAWRSMLGRCTTNENAKDFKNYYGRGIRVCQEWSGPGGFQLFLNHVGPRPSPKHSIDRINNDGNYEPGNVRWATKPQQCRNKRHKAG